MNITGMILKLFFIFYYYQEVIYAKHGKHPKEAMFFLHALPLPGINNFQWKTQDYKKPCISVFLEFSISLDDMYAEK